MFVALRLSINKVSLGLCINIQFQSFTITV